MNSTLILMAVIGEIFFKIRDVFDNSTQYEHLMYEKIIIFQRRY